MINELVNNFNMEINRKPVNTIYDCFKDNLKSINNLLFELSSVKISNYYIYCCVVNNQTGKYVKFNKKNILVKK